MSAQQPRRTLTDAKAMRALAHPVRIALLDALRAHGELTASRAAELLDESPGNISWHFQTLAKYGFVEETGTGKGRSRPWRRVHESLSFESASAADPEVRAAGEALEAAIISRALDQLQQWFDRRQAMPEWTRAGYVDNAVVYVTPAELEELSRQHAALYERFDDRTDPANRPPGARAVKLFGVGHPLVGEDLADAGTRPD